jgi:hypothetical protein
LGIGHTASCPILVQPPAAPRQLGEPHHVSVASSLVLQFWLEGTKRLSIPTDMGAAQLWRPLTHSLTRGERGSIHCTHGSRPVAARGSLEESRVGKLGYAEAGLKDEGREESIEPTGSECQPATASRAWRVRARGKARKAHTQDKCYRWYSC